MMNYRYSLHKIEDDRNCPFSEEDYSLFKFGRISFAEKFARQLFEGFISENADLILEQDEIVLMPSPYFSIPTASNFLCSFFKENLNRFLFLNDRKACVESKIHRNQTYVEDYGNMSFKERVKLISNDTYYIDKHFLEDKFCIFLDDIKITGSHEVTVNRILEEYNVQGRLFFVYFAELINKNIHPSIENHYNYFALKSPADLASILKSEDFNFNTRIVKYLLLLPEEEFAKIVFDIDDKQKNLLLSLAISNNYHTIQEYKSNINKLKNKLLWRLTFKRGKEKVLTPQNSQLV